jgi:hypothetical protein
MSISRKRKREHWVVRWLRRTFGVRGTIKEEIYLSDEAKRLVQELQCEFNSWPSFACRGAFMRMRCNASTHNLG